MVSLEDLGIALPGVSDRAVVQHITQDGRVLLKLPPCAKAEEPLMEPVINVAGAFVHAWKAKHKKECKKSNEPQKADSVEKNTFKALRQLFAYADTKFIHHSIGLLSISDTARIHFQKDGPGVLILHLESGKDLEYFNIEIQNTFIGNLAPTFNGIRLPSIVYVEHPLKGRSTYTAENGSYSTLTDVEDRLRALDIDSIMENLTGSQYVLGIVVGNNAALHLLTFEQNTTGIPKPDSLVSVASRSKTLVQNIRSSPAYAKCRQHMFKMKTKPGVLWIRNVFNDENDFHRSELEKVTPDVLCKDLIQHNVDVATKADKFHCACRYLYENGTGAAAFDFGGEVPEWWDSFVKDNLEKILDPNTFVGFFYVASFSNSETITCYDFSFGRE